MMNTLFISSVVPIKLKDEYKKLTKRTMVDASNAFQFHIIEGLHNHIPNLEVVNVLPVYSFPRYCKKLFIKSTTCDSILGVNTKTVAFFNLVYFRRNSMKNAIYKAVKSWIEKSSDNRNIIFYTMELHIVEALAKLKKEYSDLKVCSIVADLPNMSNLSNRKLLVTLNNLFFGRKSYNYKNQIDCYCFITEKMADYLQVNKPFCVIEGIATVTEYKKIKENTQKIITYAGTLNKRFGVLNLVEAFRRIQNQNYKLIICGLGDGEEEIIHAAEEDKRIEFLGQIDRADLLNILKKSTLLVNPRQNIEEFTKYSFPSKNLEYLSMGRPVVAYKLDGIPSEYDELFFYVNDNTIDSLKNKIIEVCEKNIDELNNDSESKRRYVMECKNSIAQTKKIVDLLTNIREA